MAGAPRWLHAWPWALAVAIGIAGGLASARWATGESAIERVPTNPSWAIDRLAGAEAADLHTRARIARVGLLALSRDEATYYIADRDAAGHRLREDCAYLLAGGDLPGRWWSLTVYADDRFLARNDDDAHSLGAAGLPRGGDGTWRIRLAPSREGNGPWLSTMGSRAPTLALRVYRPDAALLADPLRIALPRIERESCAGEGKR
ncbi:DUF1214 domain-containing protein [Luteimonas aestuarii]|uniref:DUF1214 domain-containing protein n=1 Tax=Luteimonas aestuarii TaxID=453837 RepID=UPI001404A4CB|nr:DUF1214 domain-containing protein [Luteimonas aestuarii]